MYARRPGITDRLPNIRRFTVRTIVQYRKFKKSKHFYYKKRSHGFVRQKLEVEDATWTEYILFRPTPDFPQNRSTKQLLFSALGTIQSVSRRTLAVARPDHLSGIFRFPQLSRSRPPARRGGREEGYFSALPFRSATPVPTPRRPAQELTRRSRSAASRTVYAFNPPQIARRLLFAFRKSHSATPILSRVHTRELYRPISPNPPPTPARGGIPIPTFRYVRIA